MMSNFKFVSSMVIGKKAIYIYHNNYIKSINNWVVIIMAFVDYNDY